MINFKNIITTVAEATATTAVSTATGAAVSVTATCIVDKITTGDYNIKENATAAAINVATATVVTAAVSTVAATVTEIAEDIKRKRSDKKLLNAVKEQGIYIDANGVCHLAEPEPESDSCNCCD